MRYEVREMKQEGLFGVWDTQTEAWAAFRKNMIIPHHTKDRDRCIAAAHYLNEVSHEGGDVA